MANGLARPRIGLGWVKWFTSGRRSVGDVEIRLSESTNAWNKLALNQADKFVLSTVTLARSISTAKSAEPERLLVSLNERTNELNKLALSLPDKPAVHGRR